jgi:hypothetical protein
MMGRKFIAHESLVTEDDRSEKHRKSQASLFDMVMPKPTLAARLDHFTDDEASLKSTLEHQ